MNTKSVTAILSAKDQGFSSTFKRSQSALAAFAGESRKSSSASGGFLGSITSVAAGMGLYNVAAKAMAQVTGSVTGAMSRADTLYLFNRNVTQTTGSATIASQALEKLSATTTDTAYSLDAVANATQTFNNAQVDLGKSAEYSARFMDMISRYGDGTNETYKQVMVQMGQMTAKGTANLGDIKSAVEANIPVWSILSKATGKSMGELRDEVEAGKWTSEEFFDAMMKGTEDIKGAAKDGANTWAGAIGIMKSRFTLGMTEILNSARRAGEAITGDRFGLFKGITMIGTVAKTSLASVGKAIEEATPFIMILKQSFDAVLPPIKEAFDSVIAEVELFNGTISKQSALESFSSIVGSATEYIIKFAHFVRDNSEAIGGFLNKVPAMVAAYGSLKMITGVTQAFANFGLVLTDKVGKGLDRLRDMNNVVTGAISPIKSTLTTGMSSAFNAVMPIVDKFTSNFKFSMNTLSEFDDKGAIRNFARSTIESFSSIIPGLDTFRMNVQRSYEQINMFDNSGNIFANALNAMMSGLDMTTGKLSGFARAMLHPKQTIEQLGFSMMANTGKSNIWSAGIATAGSAVGSGFRSMASTAITAIRSLSAAMLSNPITAVLVALTAAVATFAFGWKSNFMNIQGVMSSFGGSLKNSITSMEGMFTGLEPVVAKTVEVFKVLGKILTGAVLVGIGVVVDAFRLMVFSITSVIKAVMALGQGLKGQWQRIKGDSDGADESFKKMKTSIDSIGEGFDNLKNNSATTGAINSLNEFGKEGQKVAKTHAESVAEMINSTDKLNARISESNSKFSMAFSTDEATDGIRKYTANATGILDKFYQERTSMAEKYNDLMSQAEQASGDEQVALRKQASDLILGQQGGSNASMLALHKELSEQLKNNKNVEGQALTEEQRSAMEEQLAVIREGLAEQSNLYVEAAMQRLADGEKLSQQQQTAAEAHLTSLYTTQADQITSNEAKIKDLREKAKTEEQASVKAHMNAQIEDLKATNETLLAEQQSYGMRELELMLNGNEATAEATLAGLSSRNDITKEQLGLIVQAFVANNSSIGEQMSLLGGILETGGFEGSDKLAQALKSQDMSLIGGELTTDMIAGLQALPSNMFVSGQTGQNQFISALKSGDVAGAAAYLNSGVDTGLAPLPDKMSTKGKEGGDKHAKGIESTKGTNQKAATSAAESGVTGTKSKAKDFNASGKSSGNEHAKGVESTSGTNRSAGESIANAAYDGANSRTSSFYGLGLNMGLGVSTGLLASLPAVNAAAQAIVSAAEKAVAAKAKIKSPARLFIPLGRFMGEGVAVGWINSTKDVVSAVSDVVSSARAQAASLAGKRVVAKQAITSDHTSSTTYSNTGDIALSNKLDTIISLLGQRQTVNISRRNITNELDNSMGEQARRNQRRLLKQ